MRILILLFILFFSCNIVGQNKAIWATIWSINTPSKVDEIVEVIKKHNFNKFFIQVRYRGDALYFPNKTDSTFQNNESRSYILNNTDFDPLDYAIKKLKGSKVEVHAWVPMMVITPHDLKKIGKDHIFYTHKHWLTFDCQRNIMPYNTHEGCFLDPGINQVQEYLLNILCDIVKNYNIDGVQMDYIRYPDSIYGYNPFAVAKYNKSGDTSFVLWKQKQINNLVFEASTRLKKINPDLQISAAVFSKKEKAIGQFSQNWRAWIEGKYIDHVYVMAYNTSNRTFKQVIGELSDVSKERVTIALRAWKDKGRRYYAYQINEKIKISKQNGFVNFGFYSYSGLVQNNYLPYIKF